LDYIVEKVKEDIYAVAFWDSGWNSYNNCYLIVEEHGVTLIDTCKGKHSNLLLKALNDLGKTEDEVKLVLATHGHEDHIEGANMFKKAKKVIHAKEEGKGIMGFDPALADRGTMHGFDYCRVGYHSPGSVIFYHRQSNVIFTGDFLCFFGDPLSKEGLVSKGDELRQAWVEYLQGGGVAASDLPVFLDGLKTIQGYDSDVMCTGHGGVLIGAINEFIEMLINVERCQ
jgi:glyoxylase-like metal-dependent hydrolase (beta-lactamase superfamily II)